MATEGVEIVAESGAPDTLVSEIEASSSVGAMVVGEATFNAEVQMQTFDSITMTPTSPYLSAITMIAPSPDWFTGFYDMNAINADTQTWYSEFTVTTYPWDAGTEEGDTFNPNNDATDPQGSISRLDVNTVPSTGVLLNALQDDVLPMATWTCRLEDPNSVSFEVITSDSSVAATETVSYSCDFQNNWTGVNHPVDYPSNAHWSPPVLAAHNTGYSMWRTGGMATEGVEIVAESGAPDTLVSEIEASSSVGAMVVGEATFNAEVQMQTFDSITMTPTSPYLSAITMIAPSPDWFTGFYDMNAINADTQTWYSEFTVTTYPWDAGTEEGDTFNPNNDATDPQGSISRLDVNTVPSTGVLLNAMQDDVLPMATWTCRLEDPNSVSFEVITSDSSVAATETVSYSCNFQNNWSGENHPRNYPSFAHWSPPVMTTHSDGYTMWREGGMATEGVEIVAENGWTGALLDEISGSASTGMVVVGEVTFNDNTQSQTFDSIT